MADTSNIDKLEAQLGANYKDDKEVLQSIFDIYASIASNISHRDAADTELIPYINIATIKAYLRQGKEGSTSFTEGAISSDYDDIVDILRNDIVKNGLRRLK